MFQQIQVLAGKLKIKMMNQGKAVILWTKCESESEVLSPIWLCVTLWTVAYHAPPTMGFSRQEYWSGLPFPSPGDLPDHGIEPGPPSLEADALTSEPPGNPKCSYIIKWIYKAYLTNLHN